METIKNILITSAGRRVSLVKITQDTIKRYNDNAKVYTTDMNPLWSPACFVADGYYKVPRVTESNYIDYLLDISKKEDISLIIPTIDTELSILADAKKRFEKEGINIAVSSKSLCDTFYLKSSSEEFFKKHNIPTPISYNSLKDAKFPLFAKLNNSSCSIGAKKIDTLEDSLTLKGNYIFQEFIVGREFTVDVYIALDGKVKCIVPRERIEVRAGEVSKAITVKDREIIDSVYNFCSKLEGAFGVLTIQLFKKDNGSLVFIEVNPRFGGGYPLSFYAGANMVDMLIRDILGEKLEYFDNWQDGLKMLRYDAEVIV